MDGAHPSSAKVHKLGFILKITFVAVVLLLVNYSGHRVIEQISFQFWPQHEHMVVTAVWLILLLYILWMALPFVPGIELGVALMMILGVEGVILVYVCTLLSLSLSFAIGRLIPLEFLSRFLGWLYLHKARDLVDRLEPLNPEGRMDLLVRSAPRRIIPFLLKHRFLVLAVALNLPGNALIGGGGGIGLIAGMSGVYPFFKYFLFISIAITPLPILFLAGKLPVGQ